MAGKIQIDVVSDTTKLVQGMNRAERAVSKAARNMSNSIKSFAAVFVTGSLVNGINSSIKSLDALNKTASKLGATTEELSSLGYAAERSGIDMKTFEMAMQRFVRRSSEAASGFGEARGALKELGVEAGNLNSLSLEDKMAVLADAFKGVESESDRLRIAFKLFDSSGAQLVNMLKDGGDALKGMQAESKALGSTISSSLADEASKAADAITNFSAATTSMTNNLLSSFLPALNSAFFALMDFFDIPRQKGLEELETQLGDLKKELIDLESSSMSRIFKGTAVEIRKSKAIESVKIAIEDTAYAISNLKKQTDANGGGVFSGKVVSSTQEFVTALNKLKGSLDPVGTQIKQYYLDLETLDKALKKGAISQDEYNHMLTNMNSAMPQASTEASKLSDSVNKSTKSFKIADAASQAFGHGITGAMRAAMDGATDFGEMFKNIAKDVVAQLIRILVVQQAVNAAMGAMGFGSTAGAATVPVAGMAASGGITKSGGSYLVGERGPEIVTLPGNTNITPNGGSVGASTVTVNNYGNDDVQVNQSGNDIEIVIAKVAEQIIRGGEVGNAIESRYGLRKH